CLLPPSTRPRISSRLLCQRPGIGFTHEEDPMRIGAALTTSGKAIGLCCLAVFLLMVPNSARGQVTASASLSGKVVDKNGAVVKGATVSATNKETKLARTVMTGDEGTFKIDLLPAGRYEIKVAASGFADATAENVQLLVGNTSNLDFTLNPGGVTGTVMVTSGETELVSKE